MGVAIRGLLLGCVVAVALAGCGDDDCCTSTPDDAGDTDDALVVVADAPGIGSNGGFANPTTPLAAWSSPSPNTYASELLDLSCLGTARVSPPTTTTIALDVTVRDFQSGNLVPSAQVNVFAGLNHTSPFAAATTNSNAIASLSIPSGTARIGYSIIASSHRPTYVLDRLLAPSSPNQAITLQGISNATATTLPALIGVTALPDRAISIGTVRDCQGHTLSGFIATISPLPAMPVHLPGAVTYYFDDTVGLPVRHNQAAMGSRDGRFMIIDVPATTTAFLQVWGYRDANELAVNNLTRIAQLAVPVTSSAVLVTEHDPRATP